MQAYVVCELHEKVNVLWSFIKTHLRAKVIIFLSTCKQVKFMYEAFKKLRPGVPLRSLHGKMKQFKRMAVFYDFCEVGSLQPLRLLVHLIHAAVKSVGPLRLFKLVITWTSARGQDQLFDCKAHCT